MSRKIFFAALTCQGIALTAESEIFQLLIEYFCKNKVDWGNCIDVCTDGAEAMTGHHSGAVARIKEVAHKDLLFTHDIINQEHLASNKLSPKLKDILNDSVKIVNTIRS